MGDKSPKNTQKQSKQKDAKKKLVVLESRGASFEATWTLPNGKERVKTFSVAKYGKRAQKMAAEYEVEQRAKVKRQAA